MMDDQRIASRAACLIITRALVRRRVHGAVTAEYALETLAAERGVGDISSALGCDYVEGWRDGWMHQRATRRDPDERYLEGVHDGTAALTECRFFWNQW